MHTAGPACEAALVLNGACIASVSESMANGQDARLAGVVEGLMAETGISFSRLDRLSVVAGPGSFTGVRVGVAFMRGLALAIDRPCFGPTTLEALAGVPGTGRFLGALPAKVRPPDRSWWVQEIVDGIGADQPSEATWAEMELLVRSVGCMCGGNLFEFEQHAPPGVELRPARPTAQAAAEWAAAREESFGGRARPVYVRAPDAMPMRRP